MRSVRHFPRNSLSISSRSLTISRCLVAVSSMSCDPIGFELQRKILQQRLQILRHRLRIGIHPRRHDVGTGKCPFAVQCLHTEPVVQHRVCNPFPVRAGIPCHGIEVLPRGKKPVVEPFAVLVFRIPQLRIVAGRIRAFLRVPGDEPVYFPVRVGKVPEEDFITLYFEAISNKKSFISSVNVGDVKTNIS